MDLLERAKQKLKEQEETEKPKEILITNKKLEVKKPKKRKEPKKEIKIKTDDLRTGISNITGSSTRDIPPIIKQNLLKFLECHDLIKKEDRTWYWIKIKKVNK